MGTGKAYRRGDPRTVLSKTNQDFLDSRKDDLERLSRNSRWKEWKRHTRI
jgi:hypothetical protein